MRRILPRHGKRLRSSVTLAFVYFGRMAGIVTETLEYNRCEINHSDLYSSAPIYSVESKTVDVWTKRSAAVVQTGHDVALINTSMWHDCSGY